MAQTDTPGAPAAPSARPVQYDSPTTTPRRRRSVVRPLRIGWAVLMLALLAVVWFGPTRPEAPEHGASWPVQALEAASAFDENNVRAEGAPQQQVVNGWYANDLTAIQADQLTAQYDQLRYLGALAERGVGVLAVLALTLIGDVALRGMRAGTGPVTPAPGATG